MDTTHAPRKNAAFCGAAEPTKDACCAFHVTCPTCRVKALGPTIAAMTPENARKAIIAEDDAEARAFLVAAGLGPDMAKMVAKVEGGSYADKAASASAILRTLVASGVPPSAIKLVAVDKVTGQRVAMASGSDFISIDGEPVDPKAPKVKPPIGFGKPGNA